jgi:tetratricopeptide (TPR) repeat protein
MRWKIVLSVILIVILAGVATFGWVKWSQFQTRRHIAEVVQLSMNQIETGNHERAQQNLSELLDKYPTFENADMVLAKLGESYQATKNTAKAKECWEKLRTQYPDSPMVADALAHLADMQYAAGSEKEAEKIWDEVLTRFKGSKATDDALFGKARILVGDSEFATARDAMLDILGKYPDTELRPQIEDELGKANLEVLFASDLAEGDELYTLQRGDKLDGLARRFKVSAELISRVNHLRDARNLSVGMRLKIPKLHFSILVDKSDNTLTLFNNGQFFKRYGCRTGKANYMTPTGDFRIESKVKDPRWRNAKEGKTYASGDPKNELGTRWMAFRGSILGIHGTIDPKTIGTYASNGCVGLLREDVEELYDLVPVGTPLKITGKMKTSRDDDKNE